MTSFISKISIHNENENTTNQDHESLLLKSEKSLRRKPRIRFSKNEVIIINNESEKVKQMSKGKEQFLVFLGISITGLFIVGLLAFMVYKDIFYNDQIDEAYANCGQVKIKNFRGRSLLLDDAESKISYPGQWPWIGAIHKHLKEETEKLDILNHQKFICSSSIITNWHLLTSAHCTFGYNESELFVLLGHFNLSKSTESSSIKRDILTIFVHPDFSSKNSSDIAVLKMTEKVEFTKFIQPICFPRVKNYENNSFGFVVGYRKSNSEKFNQMNLEYTKVKETRKEKCMEKNESFIADKSFCGDSKISTFFDSGEGFYKQIGNAQHYMIIGILTKVQNNNSIDFSTFVDILEFKEWIIEKISFCDEINQESCINLCDLNLCEKNARCEVNTNNKFKCIYHDALKNDSKNDSI
ncbi:hypothetical protein PVAND_017447 [Polypedilum vanderplanki]|uniref:Peptidase S1 domain-containing protein n=1 Tax=Polypedilum vanderplanki TaxID=319348 RepID=A0A9J6BIP3_POLVA|nr:hypothetical protein PVAND_017447 [Polypedilum vanderplanki]